MQRAKFVIPALLLLSACATVEVGRAFDLSAFESKVIAGTTTQSDVRAWLGTPAGIGKSIEPSGERYEQWTYYHGTGRLPAKTDAHFSMLQVKFDQQGRVRAYNWSAERQ